MSIKAIFTDMDGTLLDGESNVSPYTLRVLKKLRDLRVPFVIATARPAISVFHTIKECGLEPDYVINLNGAVIMDGNQKVFIQHTLAPEVVQQLVSIRQQPNADGTLNKNTASPKTCSTNVYIGSEWYTDSLQEHHRQVLSILSPSGMMPKVVDFSQETHLLHGVNNVWFLGDNKDVPAVEKYVRGNMSPSQVTPILSLPFLCDCLPPRINKAQAVQEVCKKLGIDIEHTAAFGDGMNDIEMLSAVGHPHVMQNAPDQVKKALPQAAIIGMNTEDGVAKRIVELFHLNDAKL